MSTLKIREYTRLGDAYPGGSVPVAQEGSAVDQTAVTFTSSSVQSAAFGANTKYIAIKADAAFCYVIGANPVATANAIDVAAGQIIYLGVSPAHKIAVIAA